MTINEIVWGKCLGTERENGKHKILSKCGVSKGPREEEAKKKKNGIKSCTVNLSLFQNTNFFMMKMGGKDKKAV